MHESRTQDLIGLLVLTRMQKIVLSLVIPKPLSVAGEKPGLMPLQKLYIYKALQKLANRDDTVNDTHSETL